MRAPFRRPYAAMEGTEVLDGLESVFLLFPRWEEAVLCSRSKGGDGYNECVSGVGRGSFEDNYRVIGCPLLYLAGFDEVRVVFVVELLVGLQICNLALSPVAVMMATLVRDCCWFESRSHDAFLCVFCFIKNEASE